MIKVETIKRYLKRIYVQLLMFSMLVALNGCIKDDLSEYNFDIVLSFTDRGGSCTNKPVYTGSANMMVYAFDEQGYFVEKFGQKDIAFSPEQTIKLTLPPGNHTLVAWAGTVQGQFEDRLLVKGVTHIKDLSLPSFTINKGLKVMPDETLFYGVLKNINAETAAYTKAQRIDLRDMTKPLHVSLEKYDAQRKYQVRISHNAVLWQFEAAEAMDVNDHYTMMDLEQEKQSVTYTGKTGLLWRLEDRDPVITIKDLETGADVFRADIKELMKKLPQVNFNCEPYIDLKIIKNIATQTQVTIIINGWKLVESEGSI